MGQVLLFTSGKGGVGKTTIAANLAYSLALQNKRVVLLDLDIGLRNLDIVMGLEQKVVYHLGDVLCGVCRLKQALIKDYRTHFLTFLPGVPEVDEEFTLDGLRDILVELKRDYEFVIIDGPAGLEDNLKSILSCVDEVLLVVNPEMCSIRDADQIKNFIDKNFSLPIHLVINKVRRKLIFRSDYFETEDIENMLLLNACGSIPNDRNVICFINRGEFLVGNSLTVGRAIEQMAKNILSGNIL